MTHSKLSFSVFLALFALAPSTRSATTDAVQLAWRLPKDARYRVVSTLEQETTTTVEKQVQRESMSQRTTGSPVIA